MSEKGGTGDYLLNVQRRTIDGELTKRYSFGESGKIVIQSTLDHSDPTVDKVGSSAKQYQVKMARGKAYIIDLESKGYFPTLRLEGEKVNLVGTSLSRTTARLVFHSTQNGTYLVSAGKGDRGTGKFVLTIRQRQLDPELAKIHEIGKKKLRI
jgi:hypothetical protein